MNKTRLVSFFLYRRKSRNRFRIIGTTRVMVKQTSIYCKYRCVHHSLTYTESHYIRICYIVCVLTKCHIDCGYTDMSAYTPLKSIFHRKKDNYERYIVILLLLTLYIEQLENNLLMVYVLLSI